jgi:hypothetical protein
MMTTSLQNRAFVSELASSTLPSSKIVRPRTRMKRKRTTRDVCNVTRKVMHTVRAKLMREVTRIVIPTIMMMKMRSGSKKKEK